MHAIQNSSHLPLRSSCPVKTVAVIVAALVIIAALAALLVFLASNGCDLGPLNAMGQLGQLGAVCLTGGALLGILFDVLLVVCQRRVNEQNRASEEGEVDEQDRAGELDRATKDEVAKVNQTFGTVVPAQGSLNEGQCKQIEEGLAAFPRSITVTPPSQRSQEDLKRDRTTIEQLKGYEIDRRDGTSWGFDTVVMRGVFFPSKDYDCKGLFDPSMTNLVGNAFSNGMHPNGYYYNPAHDEKSTPLSLYDDNLIINKKGGIHNWLVSTSFDLDTACFFATRGEELGCTGLVFFIHAPQKAMQEELFAVNISARYPGNTETVSFLSVPPEYIVGAVPITITTKGMCTMHHLHTTLFVPNPNFHTPVRSLEDLEGLGLQPDLMPHITEGKFGSTYNDYYQPSKHFLKAKKKDGF